jgi:hypothetical protein
MKVPLPDPVPSGNISVMTVTQPENRRGGGNTQGEGGQLIGHDPAVCGHFYCTCMNLRSCVEAAAVATPKVSVKVERSGYKCLAGAEQLDTASSLPCTT